MVESEGALTGRTVGAYQVGNLIGAGQLAEVYQAQHPTLTQPVALKLFAPRVMADPAFVASMHTTAIHAARLEGGNILPIYSFTREDEHLYISMPLMPDSLRSVLLEYERLPLHRAAPLLRQIAHGLVAAHTAGILHRDLKPENVLLDAAGIAFVSDFGIGRDLRVEGGERRALGTLASLIGTPAYMAPEQLRGQPTDQRADVYALAVIFYEMLTGTTPYSGNTVYEVAAKALTTPIQPPTQLGAAIPPLLEKAILRALARDPAARWPTLQRFVVGFNAALPPRLDETDGLEMPGKHVRRSYATMPLAAVTANDLAAPVDETADETAIDETPTLALAASPGASPGAAGESDLAIESEGSGVLPAPDLRLFRVDPLPPLPARRQPTWLLLAAVAALILIVLGAGGVLLANAAQSSHSGAGLTPPAPTATSTAAQFFVPPPVMTPHPTATATPKPQPTATRPPAPRPTATPKPQPTATPTPQPTATPTPTPQATAVPTTPGP